MKRIKAGNPFYYDALVINDCSCTTLAVVYLDSRDCSKVALLCGGGSGHEPAHAGYVGGVPRTVRLRTGADDFERTPGKGMLTGTKILFG